MTQSIIPCILIVHLPKKAKTTANCCKRAVSIQNLFAYNTDRIHPLYAGRVKNDICYTRHFMHGSRV